MFPKHQPNMHNAIFVTQLHRYDFVHLQLSHRLLLLQSLSIQLIEFRPEFLRGLRAFKFQAIMSKFVSKLRHR